MTSYFIIAQYGSYLLLFYLYFSIQIFNWKTESSVDENKLMNPQAARYKSALFPVVGAVVGGVVAGPIGLMMGAKLGATAGVIGGIGGELGINLLVRI